MSESDIIEPRAPMAASGGALITLPIYGDRGSARSRRSTYETNGESRFQTSGDLIADIVLAAGGRFFRDEFGCACGSIPVFLPYRHRENWPIVSKPRSKFYRRVHSLIRQCIGVNVPKQMLLESLDVMEALADEGPEISLGNRFAKDGDAIVIDMANDSWQNIRVTTEGWRL